MTNIMLIAGLALIGLGGATAAARRTFAAGLWIAAAGAAAVGVGGFLLVADGSPAGAQFTGQLTPSIGVDRLSGLFLAMLGVVAAPALAFSVGYLRPHPAGRAIAALTSAFLLVLALVLVARDPVTLLGGWEAMTLLPAAVILIARRADEQSRRTVFAYLAITHVAGVGTWIAVLLAARHGMIDGTGQPGTAIQLCVAAAALIGMGTKAGVMPLHVWLPRAHPIAPAPVSALMSGVMIKIAIYALVRVLVDWVGPVPVWFGVVLLAAGALSALGGIVYALFQRDLKRLLALSSIENVGIVLLGIGAYAVLRARGADAWAGLALAAALLHAMNHAVIKALLFLGAGAFERATGQLRLDRLGGLLKRMPVTGTAFLVGAAAIAGVPPLNAFASEWATMQALLRVTRGGGMGDGLAGAIALGALAATAALALMCFVKVIGLVLLGPARYAEETGATPVREGPRSMAAAMAVLAAGCVLLGLAPGLLFGALVDLTVATPGTTAVGLDLPGSGSLPTVGLAVALIAAVALLTLARGRRAAAPAPTWACGQVVGPELRWTSAGFTKPLRLVLEGVLRPHRETAVRVEHGVVQEASYSGHIPQHLDDRVYRPLVQRSAALAAQARRLQSGSLGRYVAYLIGLVVMLLGAARIGLIG